mmetsp:Transcript_23004/g.34595  ORF Transcript_23004/g.34595 Transcript_23004/m.34595 type:complete len:203 (+) Transcript_23004:18-626(+)
MLTRRRSSVQTTVWVLRQPKSPLLLLALLHHGVLLRDEVQHCPLAGFLQFARNHDLVKDVIRLVKVEDQVQLANVAEIAIEALHEVVDGFESQEFVVVSLDAGDEEEARIALVDDLEVPPLQEVADLRGSAQDQVRHFLDSSELVALQSRHKPLLQTCLALSADEKHVLDHVGTSFVRCWSRQKQRRCNGDGGRVISGREGM